MYTAAHFVNDDGQQCAAVGIADGLAAVDRVAFHKGEREQHFPLDRLDKGLQFKCMEGQASVTADADRIKGEIGDGGDKLDRTVHAVVAASALRRALEEGGNRRRDYMEAVRQGALRQLRIDLRDSTADTEEVADELVEALSCSSAGSLEVLEI